MNDNEIDREDDELVTSQKSVIAEGVERLQKATLNAASKRERLPQPTFWYLFHSELKELKAKKKQQRALQEIFSGIGGVSKE